MGAVRLELADRESDSIDAVLAIVEHVIVAGRLSLVPLAKALPADVYLARVGVVREALLSGLIRAILLHILG